MLVSLVRAGAYTVMCSLTAARVIQLCLLTSNGKTRAWLGYPPHDCLWPGLPFTVAVSSTGHQSCSWHTLLQYRAVLHPGQPLNSFRWPLILHPSLMQYTFPSSAILRHVFIMVTASSPPFRDQYNTFFNISGGRSMWSSMILAGTATLAASSTYPISRAYGRSRCTERAMSLHDSIWPVSAATRIHFIACNLLCVTPRTRVGHGERVSFRTARGGGGRRTRGGGGRRASYNQ